MSYSRREALVITDQKKRECNTKALRIVESMLEDSVKPDWLLDNVKYISQSHFQDAIEERAISKQCGYPLCNACLGEIPSQQFHISVKTNKVYDITERKYFCSNSCYKASQFLKEQLLTSPVWLRDSETIPTFQLLPPSSPGGHFGKEVQFDCDIRASVETNEQLAKVGEPPIPVLSENCHLYFNEKSSEEKSATSDQEILSKKHGDEVISNISCESLPTPAETSKHQSNCKEIHDKPLKRKGKAKKNSEQPLNYISFVGRIEKCFSEWFTLDSLIFIFGIDRAKVMLKDRVDCLKSNNRHPQMLMDPVMERKYTNLCKKLNILDIEDNSESDGLLERESRPLPNLKQLREDSRVMEIKVKEFYKGSTMINLKDEQKSDDANENSAIPLIDLHSQNALRRRIILDRLRHILPDLLRTLGMNSIDISEDLRGLFTTFSLKADNIMFKPAEWNLISLIILRMLSMRDTKLKTLMETQLSQKYCSMMLMAFQLDYGYLDRLILSLCEADSIINVIQ